MDRRLSSLVQSMRERTTGLHAAAEGSGVVAALMRRQVSRERYALYLRNLLPAYQAMEQALRRQDRPELAELAQPSIYRAESIVADLDCLAGAEWGTTLPLLPAGEQYAARVEWAGGGAMLIAHCYTRYLGDLNGGQTMARRLADALGPNCPALAFSAFPAVEDVRTFIRTYRAALDRAGDTLADAAPVIEEAVAAFQLNIALSEAVAAFDGPPRSSGATGAGHPSRNQAC